MRRQTVIALAVAVVLGLARGLSREHLSSAEAISWSSKPSRAPPRSPSPRCRWITASTSRPTRSSSSTIRRPAFRPAPSRDSTELLPAGKRRVALRPIQVNEPILATKLAGEGHGASIAALLPDGMRAAAVRINDVSGVAGFVQPNDTVDVLITRQHRPARTPAGHRRAAPERPRHRHGPEREGRGRQAGASPGPRRSRSIRSTRRSWRSASSRSAQPGAAQARRRAEYPARRDGQPRTTCATAYYGGAAPLPAAAASRALPRVAGRERCRAGRPPRRARRAGRAGGLPTNSVEVVRGTTGSNYEVGGYGS